MPKKRARTSSSDRREMSPQEGAGVEVGEPDAKAAKGEQASGATMDRKKAGRKAKRASSNGKGKSSGAMAEKATAGPDSSSPTDEQKQTEAGQSPAAPSKVARSSAASEVTLSNGLTSVPTGHPPAAGAAEALQLLLQAQRSSLSAAAPAVPPPVPTQALLLQQLGVAPTPPSNWPHAYIQQAYLQQQLPGPHQNQPSTAPQLSASSMTPWALAQLQLGLLAQNGTGGLGGALRPPTTTATAANPPLLPATSPQEQLLMYQRLLQGQLPVPPHQQLPQAQAQAPQSQHPSPEALLLLQHLSSSRAQPPSHLASSLQLQQLGGLLAQNRPASLPPAQAPAPAPGSAALASASLTSRPLILQGLLQQSALKSQLSALVLLQRQQHALAQTPSPALGSLLQAVASGTDETLGTSGAAKTSGTESPSDQSSEETAPAPTAGLMANLAAADLAAREQIDGMMKTKEKRWMVRYEELIEFRRDHGHCCVPHGYSKNRKLSWWVMNQRAQYQSLQQGKKTWLSDNRVRLLEAIDFDWAPIISKSLNR